MSIHRLNVLIYPVGTPGGEVVASLLNGRPGIDGIYRVGDIAKGRRLAALSHPGLLVIDATQGDDAVEFARDVRTCNPLAQVLVLCGEGVSEEMRALLDLSHVHALPGPWTPETVTVALDGLMALDPSIQAPVYSARLERIGLLDLLKIKAFAGDSAVLNIIGGKGESGQIYVERGSLIHARAGRLEGLEALRRILSWAGGSIQEISLPEEHPRTIEEDTAGLLLEVSRDGVEDQIVAADSEAKAAGEKTIRHHIGERTVHLGEAAEDQLDQLESLPKILIIDDNPMILRYTDEVLARHWPDHALIAVQTVAEGEACMSEYQPRIVLLDHHLPDGSGADLADRWAREPATAQIPIVMISGYTEHLIEAARRCPNIVATLAKPFTPGQLIEAVRGAESFLLPGT
jgi:CheY-like chemotaxis protein